MKGANVLSVQCAIGTAAVYQRYARIRGQFYFEPTYSGSFFGRPLTLCGLCHKALTPMVATKRCENCWEMEGRIQRSPAVAYAVLRHALGGTIGPIWRTRDGRYLPVRVMELDHLRNAIWHLRTQGFCTGTEYDDALTGSASARGDMATYYADQEVASLRPHPSLDMLERELQRRGS